VVAVWHGLVTAARPVLVGLVVLAVLRGNTIVNFDTTASFARAGRGRLKRAIEKEETESPALTIRTIRL